MDVGENAVSRDSREGAKSLQASKNPWKSEIARAGRDS
jgi:hypothetical protein